MTYTFELDQYDSISYHQFTARQEWEKKFGNYFDYEEVLDYSLKSGFIKEEKEISSFCDGSNHAQPYFSSLPVEVEAEMQADELGIDFDEETAEYEA